jgi:redox-sensing transcriptional repressor
VSHQVDGAPGGRPREIPEATIARLALYLRALTAMGGSRDAISSDELANAAGVNSATVRKDLSHLGTYGVRGVGYDAELLVAEIGRALGSHHQHRVALVGVGNLGAALAGYPGFVSRGLTIGALFDVDPRRIGARAGGIEITDVADIVATCARERITIGVIATPEAAAQSAADALVGAGVRAILTFTPGVIQVPPDVDLRTVDLAVQLQILAFHESRRQVDERPAKLPGDDDVMDDTDDAAVTPSLVLPEPAFAGNGPDRFSYPVTASPTSLVTPLTVAAAPAHSPRSPR